MSKKPKTASFQDNQGRRYTIKIDAPTITEIRESLDVNLADKTGQAFEELAEDPVKLVNCLYLLCMAQADTHGITDRQFGESLTGDAIEHATDAMCEAIRLFFPRRTRSLLRALSDTREKMEEAATRMAMERIEDPKLMKKFTQDLELQIDSLLGCEKTPSISVTSTPESSDSGPTDSPSES